MKVVEINMCENGSTGKIMLNIAKCVRDNGGEALSFSTYHFSKRKYKLEDIDFHYYYGSQFEANIHYILGRIFDNNGFYSHKGTKELIAQIEKFSPDVIHIHNLHRFCINLPLLFNYFKNTNKNVVWTLHDCWSFTGHCAHFAISKCEKWKEGCNKCKYIQCYPKVEIDRSKGNYKRKKEMFTGLTNMTIVTPSNWLKNLVGESFLNQYPIEVINNGIDLNIFKPRAYCEKINYLKSYHIVLGVSFSWGYSKGLDVFNELPNILPENYRIVLVGVDSNSIKDLDSKIIPIKRTNNQEELAAIYSAAEVFVNPTREDTFPTVNIESLACGTPVITFDSCGSPEIIDETCGFVIDREDVKALAEKVIFTCEKKPFKEEDCVNRASAYNKDKCFKQYVKLFERVKENKI